MRQHSRRRGADRPCPAGDQRHFHRKTITVATA
jgi:hypothetical protein